MKRNRGGGSAAPPPPPLPARPKSVLSSSSSVFSHVPPDKLKAMRREVRRHKLGDARDDEEEEKKGLEKALEETKDGPTVVVSGLEVLDEAAAVVEGSEPAVAAGLPKMRTNAELAALHKEIVRLERAKIEMLWLLEQVRALEAADKENEEQKTDI